MNCIFCEIIAGRLPAYKIYETNHVIAFLDINPVTPGHTLIVPRKHIPRLDLVTDPACSRELMDTIIHLSSLLIQRGIAKDFTVYQANGKHAEQEISHLHFHLIPRFAGDDVQIQLPTNGDAGKKENLEKVWRLLKGGSD